ncbi:MAG: FtsW/RodA/SpoVE family cell cycle protein, partial [Alphaproteobacteria bacterium]|nr:FtsW/RodA/SpoVE family cell cycle protein [Alphaproteobacteria bacterium]
MNQKMTLWFRRWYHSLDRWTILGVGILILIGFFMVISAGPYVARRIGAPSLIFMEKYLTYLVVFLPGLIFFSMQSKKSLIFWSILGFALAWGMTSLTLVMGAHIKGASRWIHFSGFTLQPSELMKPFFAILQAFILIKIRENWRIDWTNAKRWLVLHFGLLGMTILPLLLQPDIGMTFTFLVIWGIMVFVIGVPWRYLLILGGVGVGSLFLLYATFSHFQNRIDRFLYPEQSDTYQIDKAIEAVKNGGWLPNVGDGYVKESLPDSHADFVFVVFVEEFGALLSLGIIFLYLFIFFRGVKLIRLREDGFVFLAGAGLLGFFIFQAFFNM